MTDRRFAEFNQRLETGGERAALAYLVSLSSFRFLSVIYFEDGRGHPVHHVDRLNPDVSEAEEIDQQATYCNTVLTSGGPFATSDSMADPRLASHPARELVRSYFGLPLFAEDGSAHAVLCHYDHVPRNTLELDLDLLHYAAGALQSRLSRYGAERAVSTAQTVYEEKVGNSTFYVIRHTKAEWAKPRYSLERVRNRPDGTTTPRVAYGQGMAVGQGGFSSLEDAQEFGREWCEAR